VLQSTAAAAAATALDIRQVALAVAFSDQKPGTSGLRKKSRDFATNPHYSKASSRRSFQVLPGVVGGTLILGGDGRYGNRPRIDVNHAPWPAPQRQSSR